MRPAAGPSSPGTPPPLKVLVFAGVPPPVHGQSMMVAALLKGLRTDPAFEVFHVDPHLSETNADVGRWRPGKLFSLFAACARALRLRFIHGPMLFYYVPAPGRRVPVFRDWIVMAYCRPFFPRLVLHWHAVGLGDWVTHQANACESAITRRVLRGAAASIVLAPEVAADAQPFRPKQITVVANGIPDPLEGAPLVARGNRSRMEVLFLGLGSEDKGLFKTMEGIISANARVPSGFRLTFAGAFPSLAEEKRFQQLAAHAEGAIRHFGFADSNQKVALLRDSDVLCLPTHYAHEGQPLVILEALAYDLSVITTRWRAIPGMLPATAQVGYVEDSSGEQIADALLHLRTAGSPAGAHRRHFLAHFTVERHLDLMKRALSAAASGW